MPDALSSGELVDLVSAALHVAAPELSSEQKAQVEHVVAGLLRERSLSPGHSSAGPTDGDVATC